MSGAHDGDRVRAREDSRDSHVVVGTLCLRHVPSLNYVQVIVEDDQGGHFVDPISIEVIDVANWDSSRANDKPDDPLIDVPGWRPITDLDEAIREGLVPPVRTRQGGSWADLEGGLLELASPLLSQGWAIIETDREESAKYGDCVDLILERAEVRIDLQLYEDGALVLWPVDETKYEKDDWEPDDPVETIEDATAESSAAAYERVGWITRG